MKQLDEPLDEIVQFVDHSNDPQYLWANYPNKQLKDVLNEAKQALQAYILDIIGEDYPKDYPYDDPEAIKYFNIEKERQRAKLKEMK